MNLIQIDQINWSLFILNWLHLQSFSFLKVLQKLDMILKM